MRMRFSFLYVIGCVFLTACAFAGSYANARYYNISGMSNKKLVDSIIKFKDDNPEYKVIISGIETVDKIDDNLFYGASFFIKKDTMIIYTIINLNEEADNKKNANIGLVSILDSQGTDKAKFYQLNKLSKEKREKVIDIFETEILSKLGGWGEKY